MKLQRRSQKRVVWKAKWYNYFNRLLFVFLYPKRIIIEFQNAFLYILNVSNFYEFYYNSRAFFKGFSNYSSCLFIENWSDPSNLI